MANTRLAWASCALVALLSLPTTRVGAQEAPGAEADRTLRTFTRGELRNLAPLLAAGTVCMVEFTTPDRLPAIIVATEIDAPPATVAAIVGDPAHYPDFVPALDSVTVTSDDASGLSYSWAWQAAVFTLSGTNTLQRFAPPEGHPEVGWRFVVRSTGGDLGTGRTVFRVLPSGPSRSVLISASRMDLRDANYIARQLAGGGASTNRSLNMALSIAMVLRTRVEAERRAGRVRPAIAAASTLERPSFDWVGLEPLLVRGDLIWFESSGTDLGRVAVTGVVPASEERVRTAMLDPQGFAQGLLSGAHATVLESSPETGTRFEWGIDLPLVGTSGQMRISHGSDGLIHMDGVSGALREARWRFDTTPRPYGTLVMTWGRFDLADGLWLIRVITEADGAFRPGLSSAAQLMMVRGLRLRIQRGL